MPNKYLLNYYVILIHIQKDTFFDHILCTGLLIEYIIKKN